MIEKVSLRLDLLSHHAVALAIGLPRKEWLQGEAWRRNSVQAPLGYSKMRPVGKMNCSATIPLSVVHVISKPRPRVERLAVNCCHIPYPGVVRNGVLGL